MLSNSGDIAIWKNFNNPLFVNMSECNIVVHSFS